MAFIPSPASSVSPAAPVSNLPNILAHQSLGHVHIDKAVFDQFHVKMFVNEVIDAGADWLVSLAVVINSQADGSLLPLSQGQLSPDQKKVSIHVRASRLRMPKISFKDDESVQKALGARADWCADHPNSKGEDLINASKADPSLNVWLDMGPKFQLFFKLSSDKTKSGPNAGAPRYWMNDPWMEDWKLVTSQPKEMGVRSMYIK